MTAPLPQIEQKGLIKDLSNVFRSAIYPFYIIANTSIMMYFFTTLTSKYGIIISINPQAELT